jgi:glyoxylase-like metal-dependent hydrolase (beta-lactamase superfamily II)
MEIVRIVSEPLAVNVYVVSSEGEAVVVDTGMGMDLPSLLPKVRAAVGSKRVAGCYLTHPHADHVAAAAAFKDALSTSVWIEERDAPIMAKGDDIATLGRLLGVRQQPCEVHGVAAGSVLTVGGARFEVLVLPGHTPYHSALYHAESATVFSGDVVFGGGSFGRVDFPGGDGAALLESLRRLASLHLARVFPGHMDPIENGAERAIEESLANAEAMIG